MVHGFELSKADCCFNYLVIWPVKTHVFHLFVCQWFYICLRITSTSRDMGSATTISVDSKSQHIWIPRSKMHNRPIKTVREKNRNDLRDLDFDLVTLRSSGYVDLVYTYLWYEYDDYQRTLRKRAKPAKNGNDLGDLDVNPVTLRSSGYVDLVYTYLWYEYDDYQRSLRLS